ncbi:MAG: hypothetical protein ACYCVH_03255 [Ignavibacteriaceae bacterium]
MKNNYKNKIDLVRKRIKNNKSTTFVSDIKKLDWRGYQVESLKDGRKIVIVKPGGKRGKRGEKHDFLVLIQSKDKNELWQISHPQLYDDLKEKLKNDINGTRQLLNALKNVYHGKEPNDILKSKKFSKLSGEPVDLILKVYKWIWAQEDINYPQPQHKGRAFSYEGWGYDYDNEKLVKKRNGIIHLLNRAKK